MPGLMLHLIAAHKVRPASSALFYTGNLAPDAVSEWKRKDHTHFRDLEDRQPALARLARHAVSDFDEGVLLHLYFDWRWDTVVRQEFINQAGEEWFAPYRREIALSSGYAFHHTAWAGQVWDAVSAVDPRDYGETPDASPEEVRDLILRNDKWHRENDIGPSAYFTPERIEAFTDQVAREYAAWRKDVR